MDAAEYKHVVLGLIFLKYISDAFEAKHAELEAQRDQGADPEDPDEYRAASIFWVPKEARWAHLKANAPQPKIGTIVDEAMTAIERDNPSLTHFWTMGSNLSNFPEFRELTGNPLATALAIRAMQIGEPGPDGVTAEGYIRRVHEFDPADAITAAIVSHF